MCIAHVSKFPRLNLCSGSKTNGTEKKQNEQESFHGEE
ncbi:MAG: hypothetical protein K0S09_1784 [Sphingobacteriaceae bacterium]|nr:hypothetical protein [Sphingobacteriaceae bacterium]